MHGNVFEWCQDVWDGEFYSRAEAVDLDPVCTSGSEDRVNRGGGWLYDARLCRSAYRYGHDPSYTSNDLGFRPARFLE